MMNDRNAMAIDWSNKRCKLDALEGLLENDGARVHFSLDPNLETVTVFYPRTEADPDVVNIAADSIQAMIVDIFLQAGRKILAKA